MFFATQFSSFVFLWLSGPGFQCSPIKTVVCIYIASACALEQAVRLPS